MISKLQQIIIKTVSPHVKIIYTTISLLDKTYALMLRILNIKQRFHRNMKKLFIEAFSKGKCIWKITSTTPRRVI